MQKRSEFVNNIIQAYQESRGHLVFVDGKVLTNVDLADIMMKGWVNLRKGNIGYLEEMTIYQWDK